MRDSDLVTLLTIPLVTADLSKLTIRDIIELGKDNRYILVVLEKTVTQDLNTIAIDHLPAILQRLGDELAKAFADMKTAQELLG